MKERTCCFTGHRKIRVEQYPALEQNLINALKVLIDTGIVDFCAGGALGFDTLAAQCVLKLKQQHQKIRLILVLPCKTQTAKWSLKDKSKYEEIRLQADKVIYISENYSRECMLKRNRYLVDCSQYCICFLTKKSGGTAYTVRYADSKGIRVLNLAEK